MTTFHAEYREPRPMILTTGLRGIMAIPELAKPWDRLMDILEAGGGRDEIRAEVFNIETELLKLPQADHVLEHFFADGLYGRLAGIPAGVLFTTPIHKMDSVLNLMAGRLVIISEDGIKAFTSPDFVVTTAGIKRLILAVDDVLANTVHANPDNCRDIATLESRIYAESFNEIELQGEAV